MRFKPGTLAVRWQKHADGRGFPGLVYWFPNRKDGWLVHNTFATGHYCPRVGAPGVLEPSFIRELEARGYDLTTLQFTIRKKQPAADAPQKDPE